MGRYKILSLTAALLYSGSLLSTPNQPQIIQGEASFTQSEALLTVAASDRSIIHWEDFSIAAGEKASFDLPHAQAAILNRVTGGNPTEIYGQLLSNGSVYLINTQGIFIGKEGLVQTASFLASTLDCCNCDFLQGKELRFVDRESQSIVNEGTLTTTAGDAVLLGCNIKNDGSIAAPQGTIALAAGRELLYLPYGDEKIQIFLQSPQTNLDYETKGIHQLGELRAFSAELKADGNLYGYAIKSDGLIEATTLENQKGHVYLVAEKGFIAHTGTIEGGEVRILGEHIRLLEEAKIDASGPEGGGTVLIGGDFQGKNPDILNANTTFVDKEVKIFAGALENGDGGTVVVWADQATGFHGFVNANAGPNGGDGGFVEISGKEYLDYQGLVHAGSLLGKKGTLLLDPGNLTISGAATVNVAFTACPTGTYNVTGNTANLLVTTLTTQLNTAPPVGCDVTVTTIGGGGTQAGTITVSSAIAWTSVNSLTIAAASTLTVSAAITDNSTGAGNLTLSGTSVAINAAIENNSVGGTTSITSTTTTITSNASGTITVAPTAGNLNISAFTTGTFTGAVTYNSSAGNFSATARTSLAFNGNLAVNNTLGAATGTTTLQAATVNTGTLTIGTSGGATTFTYNSTGDLTLTAGVGASTGSFVLNVPMTVTDANLFIDPITEDVTTAAPGVGAGGTINFNAPGKTFRIHTVTPATGTTVTLNGAITENGIVDWNVIGGVLTLNDDFTSSGPGAVSITADMSTGGNAIVVGVGCVFTHGATGDLSFIATTGDITISGPMSIPSSNATFTPQDDFTLSATGIIDFSAAGKALTFNHAAVGATTSYTFTGAVNVTGGTMTVEAFDDITISATTGSITYNVPGGTLMFTSTGGADPDLVMNGILTISNGTLTIATFDDITFGASSVFTYSSPDSNTLNATLGAGAAIAFNGTSNITNGIHIMNANAGITFGATSATTYTSPLAWTMSTGGNTGFNAPVSLATAAAWSMSTDTMNVNANVTNTGTGNITVSCTGGCTVGENDETIPSRIGTAGGTTQMTIGGDLVMVSSETTAGASAFIGFTSGGQQGAVILDIAGAALIDARRGQDVGIESSGMLTMTVGGDLSLSTDTFPAQVGRAYIQGNNTMSITANNLTLSGFPGGAPAFIQGFDGEVTVVSNTNAHLLNNTFMRNLGSGKLVLVVDQQAPLPPQIGNGQFSLFSNSFLETNGGDLSIFTALPSQNTVLGLINSATLSQGHHVFGVYFSTSGIDPPPFTIFYKAGTGDVSFFNRITTAVAEMIQDQFTRTMGWVWIGPFWTCNTAIPRLDEHFFFYRKPFEYPLYVNDPITCDGQTGTLIQEEWLPIRFQ